MTVSTTRPDRPPRSTVAGAPSTDRWPGHHPDDDDYDAARARSIAGGIDRRPAVIVRVADADDVAAVISLARETGLELAVRCGGPQRAGHSTTEGGIVLDLRDMNAIDIDAGAGRPGPKRASPPPR